VVQQALVQKMNPIFEPLFADCSFGYRPELFAEVGDGMKG
jgi:retron-type reverse transcriptase